MSYLSSFCLLYLQSGNVSEKAVFKGLRTCISNAILHFKCYFAIGSLGSLGLVHSILDVGSRFKSSSIGLIHSVYIIQYSFNVNLRKLTVKRQSCDSVSPQRQKHRSECYVKHDELTHICVHSIGNIHK